jgi:hypothetical protein
VKPTTEPVKTELPTLDDSERRRLDRLRPAVRSAALDLMATLQRGWPENCGEGRWSRLLTAVEKMDRPEGRE